MNKKAVLHESGEDYLESIYILQAREGICRSVDVANFLGITKASVSVAMKKLREDDCVSVGKHGELLLTEKGKEIAERTYQKHMLLKNMLTDVGVEDETAEYEACRMEHIISDDTYSKFKKAAEQLKKQ